MAAKRKINNSPEIPLPQPEIVNPAEILKLFDNQEINLVCVLGPTASGKTHYAVSLAKEFINSGHPAEIISADSRQVYKGMDIGTGKDLEEYGDIPYHLIDIVPAGSKYNLYEYQRDFEKVYNDVKERGCVPILCGGTGLYIKAVVEGYSLYEVPINEELRYELEQEDIEELREKYAELKPFGDNSVIDSKKRLIRALEVAFYEREHNVEKSNYSKKETYFIGTLVSKEERNRRIDQRLDERLSAGLVEEVQGLMDSGILPEDLVYYGLEYKFVTQYIQGILSYDEMRLLLSNAIHQFAKRQMTWCRGMESDGYKIHWVQV